MIVNTMVSKSLTEDGNVNREVVSHAKIGQSPIPGKKNSTVMEEEMRGEMRNLDQVNWNPVT